MRPIVPVALASLVTLVATAFAGDYSFETVVSGASPTRPVELEIDSNGARYLVYFLDRTSGGQGAMYLIQSGPNQAFAPSTIVHVADTARDMTQLSVWNGIPYATYCESATETERVCWRPGSTFVPFGPPISSGDFWKGGQGCMGRVKPGGTFAVGYFYGPSEDAHYAEGTGGPWSIQAVRTQNRVGKATLVALTPTGGALLTFMDQDTHQTLFTRQDPVSGTFAACEVVDGEFPVDITSDSTGNPIILRLDESAPALVLERRVAGAWSPDSSFPGAGYQTRGRMVVDSNGHVHVAAIASTGALRLISESANGWSVESVALDASQSNYTAPDLAISPNGRLDVAYVRSDGSVVVAHLGGTWIDINHACRGTTTPHLSGSGLLLPDTATTIQLDSALPYKPAILIVGLNRLDLPLLGCVLVPQPTIVAQPMLIDGNGNVTFGGPWPAGLPSLTNVYLQYWCVDPAGPYGYSTSNGLMATTP